LWVADLARPRIEFFLATGMPTASRLFAMPRLSGRGWRFRAPAGFLSDSGVLQYPTINPSILPNARTLVPVFLSSPDGTTLDTVGVLTPGATYFCVNGDRSNGRATSCSSRPMSAENFVSIG